MVAAPVSNQLGGHMSSRTIFLSRLIGLFTILVSLSMFMHKQTMVETVETHISIVFLTGDYAYKLKRAVKYPYLDFSTVERRRQACEAELVLNRRTAPALYLEVRGIVPTTAGAIAFPPRARPSIGSW